MNSSVENLDPNSTVSVDPDSGGKTDYIKKIKSLLEEPDVQSGEAGSLSWSLNRLSRKKYFAILKDLKLYSS
jgi:hypothetical protein